MKKTLMLATAIAMIAAPAFAQTSGPTYSDAISTFPITATVQNFCRFGDTDNAPVRGNNVITTSGNANTGDQNFVVDIQDVNNNTVKQADGGFNYARFVCNTPFNVVATSTNGGLKSSYTGGASNNFLRTVPYEIAVGSGTAPTSFQSVALGSNPLVTNAAPEAGQGFFRFNIPANSGLLLQGTYSDSILLVMSPATGSSI